MVTRSAHTSWTGTARDGSGIVKLISSGVGSFEVSFPKRAADEAAGTTSPEELIGAAHSSCFAMQCSSKVVAAGGNPIRLEVDAKVSFGPDPAGGFHIPLIEITVRGEVEGMDEDTFKKVAEEAKATCPVSKALTGTTITLDAAFI